MRAQFIDASGGRSSPVAIIAEAAEELFTKYHLRILHGRRIEAGAVRPSPPIRVVRTAGAGFFLRNALGFANSTTSDKPMSMPRWPRQVLFGDIDAMFASAAVVKDPSLAGQPIAVGGPPPRGIIAAASYAVRAFGVRSAMPTAEALRLCPQLRLIPPDRPLYRPPSRDDASRHRPAVSGDRMEQHRRVLRRYHRFTNALPGSCRPGAAREAVDREGNRPHVHGRVATGKTVAKIAADTSKPDGLAVVEPQQEAAFLVSPAAAGAAGHRAENRGEARAVWHQNDRRPLGSAMGPVLVRLFGARLHWIRALARGHDHEPVVADRESKSASHETTFEHDTADRAFLEELLRGFLRALARDLRQEDLAAGGCTVKLKDPALPSRPDSGGLPTRSITIPRCGRRCSRRCMRS